MLENMTTGEKVIAGATAVGIAALIFHKPTRNVVGLSDNTKESKAYYYFKGKKYTLYKSGPKEVVNNYLKEYGIPKWAKAKKIKVGNEYRLYLTRK